MNIVLENAQKADTFASLFQHIKLFTEHITIFIEKERLYVQSMDHSRVSIFEIHLPAGWFDTYELKQQGTVRLGINVSLFFRILNAREKTQKIQLECKEDVDTLSIHFTSDNKEEFDKHFEMPLMELDTEMLEIPEIEYQAEFSIGSSNFANIVQQLKMFGDCLDIQCSEEGIQMCSKSMDQGKMAVEIDNDDLTSFAIDEGETIAISFSLSFLHSISMYNKLAKEVEIKLSKQYPMKVIYLLPFHFLPTASPENASQTPLHSGFHHDQAKLLFYLAPKIGDDDEK